MKIAILGYGKEGKSVENYFKNQAEIKIFDQFDSRDVVQFNLENFDLVFRTPSVHPHPEIKTHWTSSTIYFFEHCPCPIIGVTGTKGKGTTCSITASLLRSVLPASSKVHLVGNIGNPALDALSQINPQDVVVFELSSFQLWDLSISPRVAGILRISPDHLDVHDDYSDYLHAKQNIIAHQKPNDFCIFYDDGDSKKLAETVISQKIPYPSIISQNSEKVNSLLNFLPVPGEHNRENAIAALLLTFAYLRTQSQVTDFDDFLDRFADQLAQGIKNFQPLPHRIQFVRELNHVKYYDDNYASAFPAMDVAIETFKNQPTFLIAGGKDRHLDLTEMKNRLTSAPNLQKIILIGENRTQISANQDPEKFILADSLEEAVHQAQTLAEAYATVNNQTAIVLMSPGSASFDMFKNFEDRGQQFQNLVKELN